MEPITDEEELLELVIEKLDSSKLSSTNIAIGTDISRSMIIAIRERARRPSWKNLRKLAYFFGIPFKLEN